MKVIRDDELFSKIPFDKLSGITSIEIKRTKIKTIPSLFYQITNLQKLVISHSVIENGISSQIIAFENLEELEFNLVDFIVKELPKELSELINLKKLKIIIENPKMFKI